MIMCIKRWNAINWNHCKIYKCIDLDPSGCFCSYWQNKLKIYRNKFWSSSTEFRQLMMNIIKGIISFSPKRKEIHKPECRFRISHGMMSWAQYLWMFPGDWVVQNNYLRNPHPEIQFSLKVGIMQISFALFLGTGYNFCFLLT